MRKSYLLVNCMKVLDIQDFIQNVVCRDKGWKVRKVQSTIFLNTYNVELLVRDSVLTRRKIVKNIEFVGYDTYFEFGDINSDGKFNSWWIFFLLVRCVKFSDKYLPAMEDDWYKHKIYEFLRRERMFFISDCFFYEKSISQSVIYKVEEKFVIPMLDADEPVYLSGTVFNPEFYYGEVLVKSNEITSFDYPMVTDKDGNRYILANIT